MGILGNLALAALAITPNAILASASPAIDRANWDWVTAMRSCDSARAAAPYASDAIFVLPDGSIVKGRAAIEALYSKHCDSSSTTVDAKVKSIGRVAATPDEVYEWGTASLVKRLRNGKLVRGGGRYLTTWQRRQRNWLIIRNLAF